jgi:hypothetical protein
MKQFLRRSRDEELVLPTSLVAAHDPVVTNTPRVQHVASVLIAPFAANVGYLVVRA